MTQTAQLSRPAPAARLPAGQPGQPAAAPAAKAKRAGYALPHPVPPAQMKSRHWRVIWGFVALVVLPTVLAAAYLYQRAADQYVSTLGFVVRSESAPTGADILGGMTGLAALSGSSSSDTDILYEYLQSQTLVAAVDARLDLGRIWGAPHASDPLFAYDPAGTIEDLHSYWRRMVRVAYDAGTGLITLDVHAFDPHAARDIARQIEAESSRMINALMGIARADRMAHAQAELTRAETRLSAARQALTTFRARNNMVDPMQDLEGEIGVIHQLQAQLAEELIALDMLQGQINTGGNAGAGQASRRLQVNDARITQGQNRVTIIQNRITAERQKFGSNTGESRDYAALTGEYERLAADRDMAQAAHVTALAAYDMTRAEAQRQSRYLAAYTTPTLAQSATHPNRPVLVALIATALTLAWSVITMIGYSLRDRY